MDMNNMTPGPDSSPNVGTLLRIIGVLVLLLGLGGAGLVYWTGAPPEDLSDGVAIDAISKKQARSIEVNVGKIGLLTNDLLEDWQQPRTRAGTIAVASILVASGCFYFAQLHVRGDQPDAAIR
jgi:hypothetical protein